VTHWDEHRTDWLLGTTLNAPTKPKSYIFENVPVERIALTTSERCRLLPYVLGYYAIKSIAIKQIANILIPKIEPLAKSCRLIQNSRIGREPLTFASLHVARQLDIPFVFVPYHHPRWVGWNYQQYINLYHQADALIALTNAEKRTLIELGVAEERIFVTGNGPNLAEKANAIQFRQMLEIPQNAPIILFLGQKYRYKGFTHLAEAAKIIWHKWLDAYFVFVGPRTRFSQRFFNRQNPVTVRNSPSRLIELGTIDLQQKTNALAACTILCVPSNQESFGGVYTEAWMFNKPVIGADIPAVREVIDDGINGYVVLQEANIIAERIDYLLTNPVVAEQMGRAGHEKTLRDYNWDVLAGKTAKIYESLLH
jgi:glycosyltransferase involved in cell wall biosynthesis